MTVRKYAAHPHKIILETEITENTICVEAFTYDLPLGAKDRKENTAHSEAVAANGDGSSHPEIHELAHLHFPLTELEEAGFEIEYQLQENIAQFDSDGTLQIAPEPACPDLVHVPGGSNQLKCYIADLVNAHARYVANIGARNLQALCEQRLGDGTVDAEARQFLSNVDASLDVFAGAGLSAEDLVGIADSSFWGNVVSPDVRDDYPVSFYSRWFFQRQPDLASYRADNLDVFGLGDEKIKSLLDATASVLAERCSGIGLPKVWKVTATPDVSSEVCPGSFLVAISPDFPEGLAVSCERMYAAAAVAYRLMAELSAADFGFTR